MMSTNMGTNASLVYFSPLQVEVLPGGRYYRLCKNFCVNYRRAVHVVPAGFVTDFASVPRFLWSIFPPHGRYSPAAVFHDWLYQYGPLTRAGADKAFLESMAALKVPLWQRLAMYAGVRLGGGVAWEKYRAK